MKRLTTDHHRATLLRLRRFENVQDDVLRIDRVSKLRLHGVCRDSGLLENAPGTGEDRFCRLRHRFEPASSLCFDARLLLLF